MSDSIVMNPIASSSNLYSVGYDPAARELHIVFNKPLPPKVPGGPREKFPGAIYIYSDVPEELFNELIELSVKNDELLSSGKPVEQSVSTIFNTKIKGTNPRAPLFKYRRLT